jgi:hypothetical protein
MNTQEFYFNLHSQVNNSRTKKTLKVIKKIGQNHIRNMPSTTDSKVLKRTQICQKKLELDIKKKERMLK